MTMAQCSNRPSLIDFLQTRGIDLVFDVGANDGSFGLWLRELGYRGRIVSFEPIRAVFDLLRARADEDGDWEAHPFALGDQPGSAVLNVSELSVFSSLLPLRAAATAFDPGAAPARREEVAVATLDQFASAYASRKCFLKSDTQGFERHVLIGAKATLPVLLGVQLELPILQFYSGVWGIGDAIRFMSDHGFVVAQMHPVNYHPADPVSWVEADCVFRRADPRMD
jgi:FkbM family methyltransferase